MAGPLEVPRIEDEIARKATDAAVRILHELESRRWSGAQARAAAIILFDTVSGLVPEDVAELLQEVHDEVDRRQVS